MLKIAQHFKHSLPTSFISYSTMPSISEIDQKIQATKAILTVLEKNQKTTLQNLTKLTSSQNDPQNKLSDKEFQSTQKTLHENLALSADVILKSQNLFEELVLEKSLLEKKNTSS